MRGDLAILSLASDTAVGCFSLLWNSLHTKPGERWEDNPFVVALSFDVQHGNIDSVREAA